MVLKFNEPDLAKITQRTPYFFGYNVLQFVNCKLIYGYMQKKIDKCLEIFIIKYHFFKFEP